jgi:hypothetical protein
MEQPDHHPELDAMATTLATLLHRFDCPSAMELGEYYMGLADESRRLFITAHLTECPRCTAEYAGLKAFMAQPERGERTAARTAGADTTPSVIERVRRLVAELIQPPAGVDALAMAYRGSDSQLRTYRADGYEISLEVQDDTQHPGHKTITGLVLGVNAQDQDRDQNTDMQEIRVTLRSAGEAEAGDLAVGTVDELGNFVLGDVPAGIYDLTLRLAGDAVEIVIAGVNVSSEE